MKKKERVKVCGIDFEVKPLYKKIVILLLLVLLLAIPASASFSTTFPTTDISDWTVVSGSWDANNGYLQATATGTIRHSIGSGNKYFEFNLTFPKESCGGGCTTNYVYWAGTSRGLSFALAGNGLGINLNSVGFTLVQKNLAVNGMYRINLTESGSNINFKLYNSSGELYNEQTVAYTNVETDNLRLDFVIENGLSPRIDNIVISPVAPTASTSISWDDTEYLGGRTETFTWAVSDSDWAGLGLVYAMLKKNGEYQTAWSNWLGDYNYMTLTSQTGSYPMVLPEGNYEIELYDGLVTGMINNPTYVADLIGSDTMRVLGKGNSDLVVNSTQVPAMTDFRVFYYIGYGYTANDQMGIMVKKKTWETQCECWEYKDETWFQIGASVPTAWTTIHTNSYGEYQIVLYDRYAGQPLDTAFVTANLIATPPQFNISQSVLTIERQPPNFYMSEYLKGYYAIDNNNWTGKASYLAVRNTTSGIVTAIFEGTLRDAGGSQVQQGSYGIILTTGHEYATNKLRPGNNTLELHAKNATYDIIVNQTYFSLSATDDEGYMLEPNKYIFCPSDQIIIRSGVPTTGYLKIANYKDLNKILYNARINGTDLTTIWKTKTTGDYMISLTDNSNVTKRTADIVISNQCIPSATAVPVSTVPTGGYAVSKLGDNLRSFMTMPAFWGLMATIFLFLVIGKTAPQTMGFGMFLILNVESIIGLWAPYTYYILATTWIFAGIYFTMGRRVITG